MLSHAEGAANPFLPRASSGRKKRTRRGSCDPGGSIFFNSAVNAGVKAGRPQETKHKDRLHNFISSLLPGCSIEILRKEVIQPQVPLRLPCYDLVPIAEFIFGA